MIQITSYLQYDNIQKNINGNFQNIHIVKLEQNNQFTLLISKVSEAIYPFEKNNHLGEGATLGEFIENQKGIRFVMNGGYSHYRKNFYDWPHQDFNIGDPVGLVKIRDHLFQDSLALEDYGFFLQEKKNMPWKILSHEQMQNSLKENLQHKYILGCTPLLIHDGKKIELSPFPILKEGKINPPSILAHGQQCHPRTSVGIKDNELYFIFVEGAVKDYVGATLFDLQEIGIDLKLDSLLNLDGGGSSQFRLYYDKKIISNQIHSDDANRVLGHVLALFDKN